MSSLHRLFKTDAKKETEGVLVQFPANEDGTIPAFRIRRSGSSNQTYAKALERECEPHRRKIQLNALDESTSRNIMMRVFCKAVLLDWENVQDEKGKAIPFGFDAAMQLFNELPELYTDLNDQASKLTLFRYDETESATKN